MRRALALCAVALLSCAGKSNDPKDAGAPQPAPLSAVELCDRLSAAECGALSRCFPAFARDTDEGCRAREQTACLARYNALQPSFDRGAVKVDEGKLSSCEARMSSGSCPPTFPPGYSGAAHAYADCTLDTGLIEGAVPPGQTCRDGVECAPGSVCFKPNGVCLGTCATPAADGEPCAFGCGAGLYCDDKATAEATDDRCAKLKGEGDGCQSSIECQAELYCAGTCRKRGGQGASCSFDPARQSTCAAGLACDVTPFISGASGTCIVPRDITQPCRFHWSCQTGLVCDGLDWSVYPAAVGTGLCVPPTQATGACGFNPYTTYVGDTCAQGTACGTDSTCKTLGGRGESCEPTAPSCTGAAVFCKPLPGGSGGTCSGPASLNEYCGVQIDSQHTVYTPCAIGYCDETLLTCRAGNKRQGDLCKSDAECSSSRCTVQQDSTMRCADACP